MRAYAIGDIHGQYELLLRAHDRIAADMARHGAAPIFHLGDLSDRGPESHKVIRHLREGIARGEDWQVLLGNHDRMFLRFIEEPEWVDPRLSEGLNWLHPRLGGAETLASYGVRHPADRPLARVHADALAAVPEEDLAFLRARPLSLRLGDAFFAHAGIRPGVPLEAQEMEDLIWIREPFLSDRGDHGPLIIHGHTALGTPVHYGNRVNIDSSAGYGGPLTAIVIEGREIFHLTETGRVPLPPTPDAPVR